MSGDDKLEEVLANFFSKKSTILHSQTKFLNKVQQKAYERGLEDAEKCLVQSVSEANDVGTLATRNRCLIRLQT